MSVRYKRGKDVMTPKYVQIKNQIISQILKGTYSPGQKIESESQLMERFHVSRHTIRQAIGELVLKGWLYRIQGGGTYVSNRFPTEDHVTSSSKTIGVVTTYISDYIFPSIIRGIESVLSQKGYTMLLTSTNNNIEEEKKSLEELMRKNVDGLIIEPTKSAHINNNISYYLNFEKNGIPYVMINSSYPELDVPGIMVDDYKAGLLATNHLLALGHEKILGIFKTDDLQGINRFKGFVQAHRDNGFVPSYDMILTFTTEERGEILRNKVRDLIQRLGADRPTAIVCYNDEIALDVVNVLRDLKISVPDDMSIIGFDDSNLAELSEIKLTTIKHPKQKLGEAAANAVVNWIETKEPLRNSIVFEPELIIRHSTKEYKSK